MDTFGLSDLMLILGGTIALGLVSAFGPALWRAFKAAAGPVNPRRPMYHIVKGSEDRAPVVMSRSEYDAAGSGLSSHRQTELQTDRQPQTAQPSRAELLTLYKTMRAAGIPRETARPALKAVGVPLDNNLWVEAAPPEKPAEQGPVHLTPIVGRPTSAKFETDPDYPFEPCSS